MGVVGWGREAVRRILRGSGMPATRPPRRATPLQPAPYHTALESPNAVGDAITREEKAM